MTLIDGMECNLARDVVFKEAKKLAVDKGKRAGRHLAEAKFQLATKFMDGDGHPQSSTDAEFWYTKAAEMGHGLAMLQLAWMYEHEPTRDPKHRAAHLQEALRRYTEAAARGYHCHTQPSREAEARLPSTLISADMSKIKVLLQAMHPDLETRDLLGEAYARVAAGARYIVERLPVCQPELDRVKAVVQSNEETAGLWKDYLTDGRDEVTMSGGAPATLREKQHAMELLCTVLNPAVEGVGEKDVPCELPEREGRLKKGTQTKIIGLVKSNQLNGTLGTCVRFDKAKERWIVTLSDESNVVPGDDGNPTQKQASFKRKNLTTILTGPAHHAHPNAAAHAKSEPSAPGGSKQHDVVLCREGLQWLSSQLARTYADFLRAGTDVGTANDALQSADTNEAVNDAAENLQRRHHASDAGEIYKQILCRQTLLLVALCFEGRQPCLRVMEGTPTLLLEQQGWASSTPLDPDATLNQLWQLLERIGVNASSTLASAVDLHTSASAMQLLAVTARSSPAIHDALWNREGVVRQVRSVLVLSESTQARAAMLQLLQQPLALPRTAPRFKELRALVHELLTQFALGLKDVMSEEGAALTVTCRHSGEFFELACDRRLKGGGTKKILDSIAMSNSDVAVVANLAEMRARHCISTFCTTHHRRKLAKQIWVPRRNAVLLIQSAMKTAKVHADLRRLRATLLIQAVMAAVRAKGYVRRRHAARRIKWHVESWAGGRRFEMREQFVRFKDVWKNTISSIVSTRGSHSWNDVKLDVSLQGSDEIDQELVRLNEDRERAQAAGQEDQVREADDLLDELEAKNDADQDGFIADDHVYEQYGNSMQDAEDVLQLPQTENIILSENAKAWFEKYKKKDSTYCKIFIKRIQQLAAGERSRILQKRLKGGERHAIFETYLEQKTALRILWTECWETRDNVRVDGGHARIIGAADADGAGSKRYSLKEKQRLTRNKRLSLFIWGVERHKDVSFKMDKIAKSLERLNRQLTTYEELGFPLFLDQDTVLLNPNTNNPMKSFQVPRHEIGRLIDACYKPYLKMTASERTIVGIEGTVCVLGRSGTGKTVCISERISKDRMEFALTTDGYRQCFIARSHLVRAWVTKRQMEAQREPDSVQYSIANTHFAVIEDIVSECRENLPWVSKHAPGEPEETQAAFLPNKRVDFMRFKDEFINGFLANSSTKFKLKRVNASIAWIQIKSFIKGSIEAVLRWDPDFPRVKEKATVCAFLSRAEYTDPVAGAINARRCNLTQGDREEYFKLFERYQSWCGKNGYWDDVDRLFDLFKHQMDPSEFVAKDRHGIEDHQYHAMYIDEVQDFTQAEMALIVMLSGPYALFLAGDNAQSVEEGVVFSFTDVKNVIFQICNKGVPPKAGQFPTTEANLSVNFRSHAGVLNVAKTILLTIKQAFPDAIDMLDPDAGLCDGPKPFLVSLENKEDLYTMCKGHAGIIVLTPDLMVREVAELCGINRAGIKTDDAGPSEVEVIGIRESKGMEWEDVAIVNFFQYIEGPKQQQAFKKMLDDPGSFGGDHGSEFPELAGYLKLLYTAITRCKTHLIFIETKDTTRQGHIALDKWYRHLAEEQNLATRSSPEELRKEGIGKMSHAEWRTRGIDYAIRSFEFSPEEESEARKWLRKAEECFIKAQDSALLHKVKGQYTVIDQRAAFEPQLRERGGTLEMETSIATYATLCLKAGLRETAVPICKLLKDYLECYGRPFQRIFENAVVRGLEGTRRKYPGRRSAFATGRLPPGLF